MAGAALLATVLTAAAVTGCTTSAAQYPGPMTTEQRPVDGAHAVNLLTSGDLTLVTGPMPTLTVTAGRNTLPTLTSTVNGGVVVLGTTPGRNPIGDIDYVLTLPC